MPYVSARATRDRTVADVPMAELTAHPDFVDLLRRLAPRRTPHAVCVLMGSPVLVSPNGDVYGVAKGTHSLALHVRSVDDVRQRASKPLAIERFAGWHAVIAWIAGVPAAERDDAFERLRALVAEAESDTSPPESSRA